MSKLTQKSQLYQELKAAGHEFDKEYRKYTLQEMATIFNQVFGEDHVPAAAPPTPEEQVAGVHAYSKDELTPVRVDEQGRTWFQEEVRKPAAPLPRKRRVITYVDSGVKTQTAIDGRYVETFEVSGDVKQTQQVKITMPSYQVGIYRDDRFPFKIHQYQDRRAFDLHDVHEFYGGADLVPPTIKRTYVGNHLCYDMRTTIMAINEEYRRKFLRSNQ